MSSIKGLKNTGFLATTAAVAVLAIGAFNPAEAQQRGGYQGQGQAQQGQAQQGQPRQGQRGQAQGQRGQPQMQRQQAQNVNVSEEKLEKFASVQSDLNEIRNQSQEGDTSRKQVRQKMVQTIKDNDLSLQEYNKINKAVRSNPELRKKYQEMAQ